MQIYNNKMIFETERLQIRKLRSTDLQAFHTMQSNREVMKFVRAKLMNFDENKQELKNLIAKYQQVDNHFWIFAIEEKETGNFVGTCAFVKDGKEDEIGYRFLEKYWNLGFGSEVCKGMILYAKQQQIPKLIAYVSPENKASEKILQKNGFQFLENTFCKDLQIPENKYEIKL